MKVMTLPPTKIAPMKVVIVKPTELDPRDIAEAKKRMDWLVGFMVIQYHFIYRILGMMTKTCRPYYGTMGVTVHAGGSFELIYGPTFVNELKDEELTYVMYHEILHLALHHCTSRNFDLHNLGNIAHDLAVNELIPIVPGSCVPPTRDGKLMGTFVSEFKKISMYADIREKQNAEWYYDYLLKKNKENPNKGKGKGEGQGEGDGQGDQDDQRDGQGSQGKNQGKGKGKGKDNQGKDPKDNDPFDDHGGWKEDEIADEKIRAKVGEISKTNGWGNIGGSEKEMILAAQTKRINWRNILRQFYGNLIWHEKEATRKRPNRRTGLIHPGSRKIQVDRHLVCIDTSGSIDSLLLAEFLSTINQMTEYVPIDIAQFDHGITELPRPFDSRKNEFAFSGRGGTSFQPVIDLVNERHYKSVVILTDGQAPECTQPKARVVWVMPEGCNAPVEWGIRVFMTRL